MRACSSKVGVNVGRGVLVGVGEGCGVHVGSGVHVGTVGPVLAVAVGSGVAVTTTICGVEEVSPHPAVSNIKINESESAAICVTGIEITVSPT